MLTPVRTAAVIALCLLRLTDFLFAADGPQDSLWRKAVAVAVANADWVPGLTIMRSEILHQSESVGVHEIWQRSEPGPKGEVITKVIKIREDGKDVTQKQSKEMDETFKTGGKRGGNPFDQSVQDRLSLKVIAGSKVIAGLDCIGYAFELKNVNGPILRGTAWLEKDSGIAREIENMTVEPLPDKHLKSLTMTTHYETTNGVWFAKSTESIMTVSVLLIKANLKSTMTFSEYWKRPPRERKTD